MLLGVYGFPQHNPVRNIFFPVDKATFENPIVLRRQRKCCQDADLDRSFGLRVDSDYQKEVQHRCHSLHYFADY